MSYMLEPHIYYVDTDNRLSGSHSCFEYEIHVPQYANRCVIGQINIPKTFYLVQSGQNTLTLTEDQATHEITIPPANYNVRNFLSEIQTRLNSAGSYTYSITFPSGNEPSTGKYTITVSNNTTQPKITFPEKSTLFRQLGFDRASTNSFASNQLVSKNVVDFQLSNVVYIKSNLVRTSTGQKQSDSVLQEIYTNDSPDFSRIAYKNEELELNAKPVSHHGSVFKFTLTDLDDNVLDTNGHQINFSLIIYKRNDSSELRKRIDLLTIENLRQAVGGRRNVVPSRLGETQLPNKQGLLEAPLETSQPDQSNDG